MPALPEWIHSVWWFQNGRDDRHRRYRETRRIAMRSRSAAVIKYTVPTILGSICFFLFTIVDGIFVGHGVGTDALGAVNIVMPFVMVVNALFMLSSIGG